MSTFFQGEFYRKGFASRSPSNYGPAFNLCVSVISWASIVPMEQESKLEN